MQPDLTETRTITIPAIAAGSTVSHYRLESVLGRGGMGVVWKAQDLLLKRFVAIKFLPGLHEASVEAESRLHIEAQAAAALDHPSICTIYEIANAAGVSFIAMAYIEGETLSQRLRKGPLPVAEAVTIAKAVAAGLEAAHAREIIHRDIKSSNIMIAADRQTKILDFGIARVGGLPQITQQGVAVGTPAYMSPEQLRGGTIDHRTDLWSLGVVVYESLTGHLPFEKESREASFQAILTGVPRPIRDSRGDVPPELERIVLRALTRDLSQRFGTAGEMVQDLSALLGERPARASLPATGPVPSRTGLSAVRSIVVLPFENVPADPENEYFSVGLTDELTTSLAQIGTLRVVSRSSAFALREKAHQPGEIAELLHVDTALQGTVRRAGSRLRVLVQLVQLSDGIHLWSERFDAEVKDIFDVQEQIARKVADALKVKFTEAASGEAANRYASNFEAYDLYLQGRHHISQLNPVALTKARECFEQTLVIDPDYAPAYTGIARYYTRLAFYNVIAPLDALPKALAAASRALAIDNRLPETHTTLGEILPQLQWDWTGAEREFREALRLAPTDSNALYGYAALLTYQGRYDEAHEQILAGLKVDPLSKPLQTCLAFLLYYAGAYERAAKISLRTLELDPAYLHALGVVALSNLEMGHFDEAISMLRKTSQASGDAPVGVSLLANGLARAGRRDEARQLLAGLLEHQHRRFTSPGYVAIVYVGLEEYESAFDWLEKALEVHDTTATVLGVLPAFNPLRSDPRFADLLARAGLPRSMHPGLLHLRAETGRAATR